MLFNVRLAQLRDKIVDIESVLLEFGHLGPNELEIANPRYHNQVDILKKLSQTIQGNPANELYNRAVEADKVTNEVADSLDKSLATKLRKDVKIARRYLALRERAKYYFLMEYDCLRQVLEKIASELKLEPGLIFELDPRELSLLVSDIPLALLLMRKRYQERDILANIHIPPVISFNNLGDIGQDSYDPTEKTMMGIGITPIVTTGEAIVVLDPNDTEGLSKLKPGMVLVAKTTDPTWAPIIAAVGGNGALVTEIGGPLAHGAIVARDLGIACVQNVPMVTKRIQNGNTVKVDGKNGIVTILP